jgi:hypothetical protein
MLYRWAIEAQIASQPASQPKKIGWRRKLASKKKNTFFLRQ